MGLPFSPTLTAAALVQHRATERGKTGAKLALKVSPFPSRAPSASSHSSQSPFPICQVTLDPCWPGRGKAKKGQSDSH